MERRRIVMVSVLVSVLFLVFNLSGQVIEPPNVKIVKAVRISWEAVDGANSYRIFSGSSADLIYDAEAGELGEWGGQGPIALVSRDVHEYYEATTQQLIYMVVASTSGLPEAVATPQFNIVGGQYFEEQGVVITCQTIDADIYYTLDGSEPTTASTLYTEPVNITASKTLKAKAFLAGWYASNIRTANYELIASDPEFDLVGGIFYQTQIAGLSSVTDGAVIRYTLDGTDPTELSNEYTVPVAINVSGELRAKVFRTGWTASGIVSEEYELKVSIPSFNPVAGTYYQTQFVTINCTTDNAAIRYTLDTNDPTEASNEYIGAVEIVTTRTLKAKGFIEGWTASEIAEAEYIIQETPDVPEGMVLVEGTDGVVFAQGGLGYFNPGSLEQDGIFINYNVSLSSFYMSEMPVTRDEIRTVMNNAGWGFTDPAPFAGDDDHAANRVNWYAALVYCNLFSMGEDLAPVYTIAGSTDPGDWGPIPTATNAIWNAAICNWEANGYRLPTEMEWEYAARGGVPGNAAGTFTDLWAGTNVEGQLVNYAWYSVNNNPIGTKPVGGKLPNELGLYDMSGQVREWCWDWNAAYPEGDYTDPRGGTGTDRIGRGGRWDASADLCRVARRYSPSPQTIGNILGFRVVRNAQ